MYLKSLELQGFKSFANKIVLQFHSGITGVVGPNGSGKSNISDAIRWVLGEQSSRELRGVSMQDVIFNGTLSRKAMGYAYVSITFDNSDHALPIDYEEVTVSRRLYRSGESEYLINGALVRMRDIQEMFYDTGIGKEGYSLIGQGQVESMLNGRPEERRELFDEAAGIVKYKHRKSISEKKLASEQMNLARVKDILSEINRQAGPLKEQAERAKIFLAKRDETKICDVNLYLIDDKRCEETLGDLNKKLESVRKRQEENQNNLNSAKARYEELENDIRFLGDQINSTNDDVSRQRIECRDLEGRVRLNEDRIRSLESSDVELIGRRKKLKDDVTQKEDSIQSQKKRLSELDSEMEKISDEEEDARKESDNLQKQTADLNAHISALQGEIIRVLNERTIIKSSRERILANIEQINVRDSELIRDALKLKSDEEEQSNKRKELEKEETSAKEESGSLKEERERLQKELEEVQSAFAGGTEKVNALRENYQRESSRLDTLLSITERYEGYGISVKRVMERKESTPGILGVVADLVQTEKKYELAVETALGGSIQNIVTDNASTAKSLIAFLKENRFGRATFLPLTAMKSTRSLKNGQALGESGVVGLASELVKYEDRFLNLVTWLLGGTLVADNIDTAIKLEQKYSFGLRIVTLEGELFSAGGSITGGSFRNKGNLLGRRREIGEGSKRLSAMKKRLDELILKTEEEHKKRNLLRDRITAVNSLIQKNEFDLESVFVRRGSLGIKEAEINTAKTNIVSERERLSVEKKRLESESAGLGDNLEKNICSEKLINEKIASLEERTAPLARQQSEADERLNRIRMLSEGSKKEMEFISRDIARLDNDIKNLESDFESIGKRLKDNKLARTSEKAQIEELNKKIVEAADKEEKLNGILNSLISHKEEKSETQRSFIERREELMADATFIDRDIFRFEDRIKKLEDGRDKSIEYLWDEYGLTPVQCRELRREDLGLAPAVRKRLSDLKREIRDMGNVNVGAIEEYRELSGRQEFLASQYDDIVKSSEELRQIIERLDEAMRRQFRERFSRMQAEFDQVFRELFGGGRGTLELVEEGDILEAGIRVIAQPPGKKLQNMLQLSGGEKSLSAIALLFAIQNMKPSPFCLLDEIESALDEANVERFAKYLRRLSSYTQFIVITHRRGAMAACDRLYGITMQEKGISALVSVDLVESDLEN